MDQYVCLYARTSTHHQETGLEAQIRALMAFTETNRIEKYKMFTDEMSGRRTSRPGLDAMMNAVRSGTVSSIVVYSLSRFSRSVKHLLESLDDLTKQKVRFVSLTEQLDTSTPTGRAVITIIGAIAALEADLIRERVRNGLLNAKAKGTRLGAPKRHEKKLPLIHHLSQQGMSHREIARLTGVSQSTVSRALRANESKVSA